MGYIQTPFTRVSYFLKSYRKAIICIFKAENPSSKFKAATALQNIVSCFVGYPVYSFELLNFSGAGGALVLVVPLCWWGWWRMMLVVDQGW